MAGDVPEEIRRLEQSSVACVKSVQLMQEAVTKFYEAIKRGDYKTADTLRQVAVDALEAHLDAMAAAQRTLQTLRH